MEEFSMLNNVRMMPNIGGLSITQEFSMKSSALTTVDHGKNSVVKTGCTDGNQGAPLDLNKVTRLVEILKQCQKLFTRKEFKTLLKHRAVRSSLSDIVDLYNKGRISLEKNAINCITSFLRLIKKKENGCKKNSSNGETPKNKLELKLSVMIADLKMKSTSRDLTPRVGRTPTCSKRRESSSQASTHNITGNKLRRKSSSKSKSRSRSRSPLLRRNLFPRREHSPQSPSTKRKNSYSRYRRSGSWSPISSSRSRSRSRSHSPSRKGYYFDSRESRSRFRDHPFKYYGDYGESSSSKRPPCSRRPKSPAGLIKEKIHPNRRSRLRKSRSPSLAALRREVDKLRIDNHNAMKDLRELMTYNRSSSNSTTHDVGVPSNPYASYLPTRNDFLAQHGATVEDQCFSVSETSRQTQSNCQNSYQTGHKGSNQFPGPNMSSYSPPNNEFLPESAEQISLSKQSRIMLASLPSLSPPDVSPVPLHLPFSDILTYPFPSTDTLVTPSISPSPPSLLNEFTLLRTSESSDEPVLNEPSTEPRFSKENENVENIKIRVKCCEVERVKDPVEKVNVGNPASILKSLSNEIKKHVNIFSVSKLSFETSTSGNDTVNSSEQMNEIDPSFIEDSKREKVSVGFRFDDKDGNEDTSDTYYDTAERNLNNLKFRLGVTTVENECLNETHESAVRKFDSKKHHKVDEIQGETANVEKCKTVPSSCERSIKKSGQNSDDLGIIVKEMFPALYISEESTMHPNSVVNRKFRGKGRKICTSPIIPKVRGSMNSVFMYKIPSLKCSKVDDNIWKIVQHKPSDQTEQETAGFLSFSEEELNTHEEPDTANIREVLSVTSPELLATSMLDKMDPSRENLEKQSSELDSNFGTASFNKNEQHSPRERFHRRLTRNMMQGDLSCENAEKRSPNVMHNFGTNASIKNEQSSPNKQSSENSNRKLIGELYGSGFSNIQIPTGVTLKRCMVTLERESNLSFLTVKRSIMPPNICKESDAATMNEFLSKGVSKLSTVLDLERRVVPRENEEKPSSKLTATLDTLASNESEDCGRLSASNQSQERLNRDMIIEFNGIAFSNVKVPKGVILKKCIISLKRTSIASPSGK